MNTNKIKPASECKNIPSYFANTIDAYIDYGYEPGGFLQSVFENDLFGAIIRADTTSVAALKDIILYIYNHTPDNCWGSAEIVADWKKARRKSKNN